MKRRSRPDDAKLNITSLMDIMTIILVFLLKSYSTDPVSLKQADDLKPPFSAAQEKPEQSTAVTITPVRTSTPSEVSCFRALSCSSFG